jgi:hypothetical protein
MLFENDIRQFGEEVTSIGRTLFSCFVPMTPRAVGVGAVGRSSHSHATSAIAPVPAVSCTSRTQFNVCQNVRVVSVSATALLLGVASLVAHRNERGTRPRVPAVNLAGDARRMHLSSSRPARRLGEGPRSVCGNACPCGPLAVTRSTGNDLVQLCDYASSRWRSGCRHGATPNEVENDVRSTRRCL